MKLQSEMAELTIISDQQQRLKNLLYCRDDRRKPAADADAAAAAIWEGVAKKSIPIKTQRRQQQQQ